jgi:hypothetical protein
MRSIGFAVAVVCLAAGCTRHIRPTPAVELAHAARLPLRAAVLVPPALSTRTDRLGNFATLGMANTWECETGASLVPALESVAKAVFAEVVLVESTGAATADVWLMPEVVELRQMPERDGFWMSFQLRAAVTDGRGKARFDRTYREVEEGSTAAAVWGGAFAAAAVLTAPLERAMGKALRQLGEELREEFAPERQPTARR